MLGSKNEEKIPLVTVIFKSQIMIFQIKTTKLWIWNLKISYCIVISQFFSQYKPLCSGFEHEKQFLKVIFQ